MRVLKAVLWVCCLAVMTVGCGDSSGVDDNDPSGNDNDNQFTEDECDDEYVNLCADQTNSMECWVIGGEPTCVCPDDPGCSCPADWEQWAHAPSPDEEHGLCLQPDHAFLDNGGDPIGNDPTENDPTPDPGECDLLEQTDVDGGAVLEAHSCHRIEDTLQVDSGELVIEEGVELRFVYTTEPMTEVGPTGLEILEDGRLKAVGTASDEIKMHGLADDGTFGVTWEGIDFEGSRQDNRIEYVIVEGADVSTFDEEAAIEIEDSDVTITNSTIRGSHQALAIQRSGSADLTHKSQVQFDDNLIEETEYAPIAVNPDHVDSIGSNNEFVDIEIEMILLGGGGQQVQFDTTWPDLGMPYYRGGDVTNEDSMCSESLPVQDGATLAVEPGVEIIFDFECELIVYDGDLVAEGAPGQEIVFTWTAPVGADEIRGWGGIELRDSDSVIRHAVIEEIYKLGPAEAAITLGSGQDVTPRLLIEDTLIRDTPVGINVRNSDAELLSCDGVEYEDIEEEEIRVGAGDPVICGDL